MDKDEFVQNYGRLVSKSWMDPAFKSELQTDPAAAMASSGLPVPAGTNVAVGVVAPSGDGSVDTLYDAFESAGDSFTLWVPEQPAATAGAAQADDTSTTCTPCTTCT